MKETQKLKEIWEPIFLQIPIGGPVPSFFHKNECKTDMFLWLDDKPLTMYWCHGMNDNYSFFITGPDYVIREWLELFYIPLFEPLKPTVENIFDIYKSNLPLPVWFRVGSDENKEIKNRKEIELMERKNKSKKSTMDWSDWTI